MGGQAEARTAECGARLVSQYSFVFSMMQLEPGSCPSGRLAAYKFRFHQMAETCAISPYSLPQFGGHALTNSNSPGSELRRKGHLAVRLFAELSAFILFWETGVV